ncbi:MAG: hypothetical protein OHK0029_35030 [Armatimonadaceae bacterium]
MQQLSERIAGLSLSQVLLLLLLFTVLRAGMYSSRVPFLRALGDLLESFLLAVALVFLLLRPFVVQSYFIPSGSMRPTLQEGDQILVNKWIYRVQEPKRGEVVVFRAPEAASADEKEFIKRLIGLPGDRVEIQEGYVQVGSATYTHYDILRCVDDSYSVDRQDLPTETPLRLTTDAIWVGSRRINPEEFAEAAGKPGASVRIQPGRVLRNNQVLMECYVGEDVHYRMEPRVVPSGHYFVLGDNRNHSDDSHRWGMLPADRLIGRAEFVFWPLPHIKRFCTE